MAQPTIQPTKHSMAQDPCEEGRRITYSKPKAASRQLHSCINFCCQSASKSSFQGNPPQLRPAPSQTPHIRYCCSPPGQPAKQPTNQPTNKPTNQPMAQATSHPWANQPSKQPTSQWLQQPTNHSMAQPLHSQQTSSSNQPAKAASQPGVCCTYSARPPAGPRATYSNPKAAAKQVQICIKLCCQSASKTISQGSAPQLHPTLKTSTPS